MRTRKLSRRNYKKDNGQVRKKKQEETVDEVNPVKTKDGKGYTFKVKNQNILDEWIEVLTIRYWHHLQDVYSIFWNDITDKGEQIKL